MFPCQPQFIVLEAVPNGNCSLNMKEPFPGINPWLQQFWRDVHARLLVYAADELNAKLPPVLQATVDARIAIDAGEDQPHCYVPDVAVTEVSPPTTDTAGPEQFQRWIRALRLAGFLLLFLAAALPCAKAGETLLLDDFFDLAAWNPNEALQSAGSLEAVEGGGARVTGKDHNRDAAIWREVDARGARWIEISVELNHGSNTGAGLIVTPLDAGGRALESLNAFKIGAWNSGNFNACRKTLALPAGTVRLRVALSVLNGNLAARNLVIQATGKPAPRAPRERLLDGMGFEVERVETPRPVWEIHSASLGDDHPEEIITCDVDGVIEVRSPGRAGARLRLDAGALVYDFAVADLDGDRRPEILFTTIEKDRPLEAVDLAGKTVRRFDAARGPRKVRLGDMDGDGRPEIAVSAGRMGGVLLLDTEGKVLWEAPPGDRPLDVIFADVDPAPGRELAVSYGGPRLAWWIVTRSGTARRVTHSDSQRVFNLAMRAADIDGDGRDELVFLRGQDENAEALVCAKQDAGGGVSILWSAPLPEKQQGFFGFLETGDFHPATPGPEIVCGGTHVLFLFDAQGTLLHRSGRDTIQGGTAARQWDPGRLLIPDLAVAPVAKGKPARLWAASSRLRDPAVYRLTLGPGKPFLRDFPIADDEAHLDALYDSVRRCTPRPAADVAPGATAGGPPPKFHVFYVRNYFKGGDKTEALEIFKALQARESDNLEYLLMYDASDLASHPRGTKLTTEQIVENARWMEEQGIPFGYFAVHGCESWLSEEAIRLSLDAAPRSFRFVYVAEDFESIYSEKSTGFVPWCARALALLAPRGKKLIFKEKHDAWASIIADPQISGPLFRPEYRDAIVPVWATNQPYQPEAQFGGMLGLQLAGWAREFGMSTQYFNWGEWDLRDVNLCRLTPSDITLRLELLGAALGGTWIHIEGGQPYLMRTSGIELDPMARRHRDLVYEMIRKGLLSPAPALANVNHTALVVALHNEYERGRQEKLALKSFKMSAGPGPLRDGFLPSRLIFEPWPPHAFARLAYRQRWHVETCFPETPLGWIPVVTRDCGAPAGFSPLFTDAEKVWLGDRAADRAWPGGNGLAASGKMDALGALLEQGAKDIPLASPGACVVIHRLGEPGAFRVFLIDPGYLAPRGVETVLESRVGDFAAVLDAVTGEALPAQGSRCALSIPRGAFRILDVRLRG